MRATVRTWSGERAEWALRATASLDAPRVGASSARADLDVSLDDCPDLPLPGGVAGVTDGPFTETKEYALP